LRGINLVERFGRMCESYSPGRSAWIGDESSQL
jgi:hypothetical protein